MGNSMLYEIKNLKQSYGAGPTVLDISELKIREGSVTGLVGPNGSGKSTLLKVLAFLEPWRCGTILFKGSDCSENASVLRRSVTYLHQEPYLLKRSVYENIAYGLRLRRDTEAIKARVCDSMKRVGLSPEKFARRPWFRLSGGEAQRVALAARLALHPKVLLLDEPTANVDEASAQLVKEAAMSAWKEWGTTVVIATHELVWLHEVSTDIVSLYRGQVAGLGAENIFQGPLSREDVYTVLKLPDGQEIRGACSDGSISAAILSPSAITMTLAEGEAEKGQNTVKGTVTQIALERSTGLLLVTADCGGTLIKALIPLAQAEAGNIRPAAQVRLLFSTNAIKWLKDN